MKKMKSFVIFIALLLTVAVVAQQASPPPTETKPVAAAPGGETTIQKEMTLKEAIFYALKNNLDLQIQMINTENSWNAVKVNGADFIPVLDISLNNSENNSPSTGFLEGADILTSKGLSLDLSLVQKIALGGTIEVNLYNRRYETNSAWSSINPSLSSRLTVSINQPLLKNFGTFVTKKNIYISMNEHKKSQWQLRQQILDLVYNVENAYWQLVYAHQNLDTMKMSLKRSENLLKQNRIKVKVGAAARIDILDAEASVAADESNLLQAEQDIQTAEENLKKILNMSTLDQTLVPTETPTVNKIAVDFNAFLMEALEMRPDMQQAKLTLKNNKIEVRYYRNQMLPGLQLSASYYTTGTGGDQLITEGNPFTGDYVIIGVIEKDIWATMKDTISNLYQNYNVSLQLSVPLSLAKERTQLAQARLNMKAALLSLKNTENTIYSEVKQVIKAYESNLKIVEAGRISLDLEQRKLKAEEKKLSVGLVSNYDVIQKQRDLVQAQTTNLNALRNYNMILADINRKLGRTFEYYDIKFTDFIKDK